jgi:hypothetical protein
MQFTLLKKEGMITSVGVGNIEFTEWEGRPIESSPLPIFNIFKTLQHGTCRI